MICKRRIIETFDKVPEKKTVKLPTEKGIYYAQKVGFGYRTEERIMKSTQSNYNNSSTNSNNVDKPKRKIRTLNPKK